MILIIEVCCQVQIEGQMNQTANETLKFDTKVINTDTNIVPTDRQTDRQTDTHTHRQTDRQTGRQQTDRYQKT